MKLKPGMLFKIKKNENVFLYGEVQRGVGTHTTYIRLGRTLIFIDEEVDETYWSKNACQVYCAESGGIVSVDKAALLSHYVRMPKREEKKRKHED
tara:strand:- start:1109 stop:1393 length:285 start_codon:yes stop_codon:yes gene_type:complete